MENEEFREDQDMRTNAKNRIIELVTGKSEGWNVNREQGRIIPSEKSLSPQTNNQEHHITWMEPANAGEKSDKSNSL